MLCASPSWLFQSLSNHSTIPSLRQKQCQDKGLAHMLRHQTYNTSEWMIKKAHGMTTERNSTSYEIKVYKTILFAQIKQRRICKQAHWRFKCWRVVIVHVHGEATSDAAEPPDPAKGSFKIQISMAESGCRTLEGFHLRLCFLSIIALLWWRYNISVNVFIISFHINLKKSYDVLLADYHIIL